ncbi:GNAT family N-acetyltransferase [Pseudonocardia sp. GCM10023141]|uniref:GNAT family N-acetyltransferase n=1 Tax=Pseudonocardia sp. GCM10023141 TaxID=3252653 RepID=UPI003606369E
MDVVVRALGRKEADLLDEVMAGMSRRSRFFRFHTPIRTLSAGMRRVLLDVDDCRHIAVVAVSESGRPIGVARMIRDSRAPHEAEIAVAVIDQWHRRGVGRELVSALAARGRAVGVTRLTARVLRENIAARRLFAAEFPGSVLRPDGDVVVITAALDPNGWDITMEDIIADLTA